MKLLFILFICLNIITIIASTEEENEEYKSMKKMLNKWIKTDEDFRSIEIKTKKGKFMYFCGKCEKYLNAGHKSHIKDHLNSQYHEPEEYSLRNENKKKSRRLIDPKESLKKWKSEDERFGCIDHIEGNLFKCYKCNIELTPTNKSNLIHHLNSKEHSGDEYVVKEIKSPKKNLEKWQGNEEYKCIEYKNDKYYCNLCKMDLKINQKTNVDRHLNKPKHKKHVALQKAFEEKCLELFGESPEAGNNEEGEQTEEQTAAEGYGGYINEHTYTVPQYASPTEEELYEKTRQDSIRHYQAEEQARQMGLNIGQGSGSNVQGHSSYVLDFQNQLTSQPVQGYAFQRQMIDFQGQGSDQGTFTQNQQSGTRSESRGQRRGSTRGQLQSQNDRKGKKPMNGNEFSFN